MCGIVGYIGKRQAADLLVEGLSKLEYRGYDSAGVAIIEDEKISVRKLKGRLANLENDLNNNNESGLELLLYLSEIETHNLVIPKKFLTLYNFQ